MNVLEVKNLCKNYPTFKLDNVSFSLEKGKITGFIGRNGAGKTTTLKSIFDFIHYDSGTVEFFGKNFSENQFEIKQKTAFVLGGVNYYSIKKLKTITKVTRSFYKDWDDEAYGRCIERFGLNENKTPAQLSEGMKVKYSLALALSHNAELLILDEPTSGLDPVSRDELLDIFMDLSEQGKTILFSTHITSDLDKCADNIIYVQNGKILAQDTIDNFRDSYKVAEFTDEQIQSDLKEKLIGYKKTKKGFSALVKAEDVSLFNCYLASTDLEEIMIHIEKEGQQ